MLCRALAFVLALPVVSRGQDETLRPIAATRRDPVFTTYAAPMARSEYLVDEAYHLRFHASGEPLALVSDSAGTWGIGVLLGGVRAHAVSDYVREPILRRSFASFARFDFEPFSDLHIDASFHVYSSRQALLSLTITNRGDRAKRVDAYAFATAPESGFRPSALTAEGDGLTFGHSEPRDAWSESPPPEYENHFVDLLLLDDRAASYGGFRSGMPELLTSLDRGLLPGDLTGRPEALVLTRTLELAPGESAPFRVVRAVAPESEGTERMLMKARELLRVDTDALEAEERALFARAPALELDGDETLLYRGALSLAQQSMLPPEGRTRHNYYVFSREPTWSWGHDGQVFHESLSMLAYVHLDPESAMDSQRVFMEAQAPDGYIPYRNGPYAVRTFPVGGERTTSAPFYSWTNWEVYQIARERVPGATARRFLEDAYRSGRRFTEFLLRERDKDGDGLLEWGGHAVLESVRDSLVPIWNLLGKDDPKAPSRLEALDLSAMVVREMRALGEMARELREDDPWTARADRLGRLIDETMWDDETGFYYNVDRDTNQFVTDDGVDLRRMEIIGFLPLWAGIAPKHRAEVLFRKLTDPMKFWRRFGVPTLAADDPGFDPFIRRCCQWNGAVWLEWDYLVLRGLLDYGYEDTARALGDKMLKAAEEQLRRNHRFWESYSPDEVKLGSPQNYIWDALLARVLIDLRKRRTP